MPAPPEEFAVDRRDGAETVPEFTGVWRYHRKLAWLWRRRRENPFIRHGSPLPKRRFGRRWLLIGIALAYWFCAVLIGALIALGEGDQAIGYTFLFICFGWPPLSVMLLHIFGNNRRTIHSLEEMRLTRMYPAEIVFGSLYWPTLFFAVIIGVSMLVWLIGGVFFGYQVVIDEGAFGRTFFQREIFWLMCQLVPVPLIMTIAFHMAALRGWLLVGRSWALHMIYTYAICLAMTIAGAFITGISSIPFGSIIPGVLICSTVLIISGPYWACRFAGELFFNPLQPVSRMHRVYEETFFWHGRTEWDARRRRMRIAYGWIFGIVFPALALAVSATGITEFLYEDWEANTTPSYFSLSFHHLIHWMFSPIIFWAMLSLIYEMHWDHKSWKPFVHWGLIAGLLLTFLVSLQFLFVLPIALIGILFFGIGLLGFSPYFAFIIYLLAVIRSFKKRQAESSEVFSIADFAPAALLLLLYIVCGYAAVGVLLKLIAE